MPDTKITALTAIGANPIIPATFPIPMVDLTDTSMAASGTTKKVTVNQILGSGGTATLASATITGDLTVDTNVLKVDTTNNRVGIGTATPGVRFDILSDNNTSLAAVLRVNSNNAAVNTALAYDGLIASGGMTLQSGANPFIINTNGANERYRIAADGVATWSNVGGFAGTAMTLNSTGLGVGVSPNTKLAVTHSDVVGTLYPIITAQYAAGTYGGMYAVRDGAGDQRGLAWQTYKAGTGLVESLRLSSDGNVGIGVTPSAWGNNFKVVQVGQAGAVYGSAPTGTYGTKFNLYNDNTNDIAITSNYVGEYRFDVLTGSHIWYNKATAGSVGVAQTLVPAMTLDRDGRLILRSLSTPATLTVNGQLTVNATSDTNLRFSYRGSDGVTRVANLTLA
jgi:hypothetical protein